MLHNHSQVSTQLLEELKIEKVLGGSVTKTEDQRSFLEAKHRQWPLMFSRIAQVAHPSLQRKIGAGSGFQTKWPVSLGLRKL